MQGPGIWHSDVFLWMPRPPMLSWPGLYEIRRIRNPGGLLECFNAAQRIINQDHPYLVDGLIVSYSLSGQSIL